MTMPARLQAQDAAPPSDYVSRAEYDKLKAEHEAMKQELDALKATVKQLTVSASPSACAREGRQRRETGRYSAA